MNLNAIVGPYVAVINPPLVGSVVYSTGYVIGANYKRTSTSTQVDGVTFSVQALTSRQIEHVDALNIQGILRSVYFNGVLQGLNRPAGKGGDVLLIPTHLTAADFDTWLVVEVSEPWDTDGWVRVVAQLQNPPVSQ